MSTPRATTPIPTRHLLGIFMPMALSAWVSTLAPPLINAAIVRASTSYESALAAYGVARNLVLLLSPFAVMVPTAVLVLVTGVASRRRLREFLGILGVAMALFSVLILVTPMRHLLLERAIGLEPTLADRTRLALLVMVAFPLAGIWRGFSQGLLIRRQRTRSMVVAGLLGFGVCLLGVYLGARLSLLRGEVYGAIILVAFTTVEAAVLHVLARRVPDPATDDVGRPSYRQMLTYFIPLTVTTWVMAVSRTVIDAGLARTVDAALALAAFSVAVSVTFSFEAPIVTLRTVVLAYEHDEENRRRLRRFCLIVGGSMTGCVWIIGFTPLGPWLLDSAIGVAGRVAFLGLWGIRLMAPALLILSWRQFNYGILMKSRRTDIIAWSAIARLVYLAAVLWITLSLWPDPRTAAVVYALGFLIEAAYTRAGARRIGAL